MSTMRITDRHLDLVVEQLNKELGRPITAYRKDEKGSGVQSNIGNIHTSHAYGGVELHEMANEWGGVNVLSTGGYTTKRDLYNQIQAMLTALRLHDHNKRGASQ